MTAAFSDLRFNRFRLAAALAMERAGTLGHEGRGAMEIAPDRSIGMIHGRRVMARRAQWRDPRSFGNGGIAAGTSHPAGAVWVRGAV